MWLAPEDEDVGHHPEELSGVGIRFLQPPGPGRRTERRKLVEDQASNTNERDERGDTDCPNLTWRGLRFHTCCYPRNVWAWGRRRRDLCREQRTHPGSAAPPPGCLLYCQPSAALLLPRPTHEQTSIKVNLSPSQKWKWFLFRLSPSPSSSSTCPVWAGSGFSADPLQLCRWLAESRLKGDVLCKYIWTMTTMRPAKVTETPSVQEGRLGSS